MLLRNGLVDTGTRAEFSRADILVEDGRIARVGSVEGVRSDVEVVDCSGYLVVPGLIDAHYHSNDGFDRGRWDNLPLEPWMMFSYPALAAPALSAREVYIRTVLSGLELVRSGVTCVVDFLYELAGFTDESLAAVVSAYRDLGLRATIALGMSDRAFHETVAVDLGLIPPDLLERLEAERPPPWDEWEAFARRAVERFHRPETGISIALAPSGPQRCSDRMLAGTSALAGELDLIVHIHVLETRLQAYSSLQRYGTTLPKHLESLGFLSERVSFDHGIWLTDEDLELIAGRGVNVVHNPISNMKLGSGICPVPELLKRGVTVALGADSASCNDGCNMLESVKIAALVHKLWDVDYEEWLGAAEAWTMATTAGARAAGDPEGLGRIREGARADLVLFDLDDLAFTPLNVPLNQLVFCAPKQAVAASLVGGRWILRDGTVTGVDESAVKAEAREIAASLGGRSAEALEIGGRLLASVRAGWLEAMRDDVGVRRLFPAR